MNSSRLLRENSQCCLHVNESSQRTCQQMEEDRMYRMPRYIFFAMKRKKGAGSVYDIFALRYWAVLDNLIDCQNRQYWIMIFSETCQAEYMNKNWDCIHVP